MPCDVSHVWEFTVSADQRSDFERHYGPDGTWVALFRQADGYIETRLLRDRTAPERYLSIDRWQSDQAYRAFRRNFAAQYAALDVLCEAFTRSETPLGAFDDVPPGLPASPV